MSEIKVNSIKGVGASTAAITVNNTDGTCTANITNNLSNRNLIINGAMQVAQRGTSYTGASAYGSVDRWYINDNGVDENPTQAQVDVASGTTPYSLGFRKALKITNGNQTGGVGGTDRILIQQRIESQNLAQSGWNYTSSSSFITLSFWCKSSVAQTFQCRFQTQDGTQLNFPFETGSLSADTWTKVVKIIPGNSNLTFDVNNEEGMKLEISLIRGTDYTDNSVTNDAWATYATGTRNKDNTTTWYTTNDATFELTGVQLEVSDFATSFEFLSFADELRKCQRYYFKLDNMAVNEVYGIGMSDNDDQNIYAMINFPDKMRTAPTALEQSGSASDYQVRRDTTKTCTGVPTFTNAGKHFCRVNFPRSSHGWGTGQMLWCMSAGSSGYLGFSAEL
jgi:hypothetical protein